MSGSATFTIVTSTSSMKVPRQTAVSGNHLRIRSSFLRPLAACRRGCSIADMAAPEIADSLALEPDDVRIIRALQVDPRVGFATMASVLGLSEPTIARRYRRMSRAGAIRVVGVVNPGALGQSLWI